MTRGLPRALMTLAGCCLGDRRREWALAMEAEFEEAALDGNQLSFASGCLIGAIHQMPAQEEGRFAVVSHLVAIGLIVPFTLSILSSALTGFSAWSPGSAASEVFMGGHQGLLSLNESNAAALPALTILVSMLSIGQIALAWLILDRDWVRVSLIGRLNVAATMTLFIVTAVLFLDETWLILPAAGITLELAVISALIRWHSRIGIDTLRTA